MTETAEAEVTQFRYRPYNAIHSFGFQLRNTETKFPLTVRQYSLK